MSTEDRCEFTTTRRKGALLQSARGGDARYERCRNRAKYTVTVVETSLAWSRERTVRCCGLHKRMHEERMWMP